MYRKCGRPMIGHCLKLVWKWPVANCYMYFVHCWGFETRYFSSWYDKCTILTSLLVVFMLTIKQVWNSTNPDTDSSVLSQITNSIILLYICSQGETHNPFNLVILRDTMQFLSAFVISFSLASNGVKRNVRRNEKGYSVQLINTNGH